MLCKLQNFITTTAVYLNSYDKFLYEDHEDLHVYKIFKHKQTNDSECKSSEQLYQIDRDEPQSKKVVMRWLSEHWLSF